MRTTNGRTSARPQLSDDAASYIRERIIAGELRPGQFVRIDHLATELAMSITPVRQALVTLRGEGFIHLEPRRGFIVAPLSPEDIKDLFWVQAFVAGELAAHAARSITTDQIKQLYAIIGEAEDTRNESGNNVMKSEALAHEFHEVVTEAAARPKLAWMHELSRKYEPHHLYAYLPDWHESALNEHRAVLEALEAHDADAARAAMWQHVVHLGDLVARHLGAVLDA